MAEDNATAVSGVTLAARVDPETKQQFFDRCEEIGKSASDTLREFIVAFNEDRLKIRVPETQLNTIKGLHYVD